MEETSDDARSGPEWDGLPVGAQLHAFWTYLQSYGLPPKDWMAKNLPSGDLDAQWCASNMGWVMLCILSDLRHPSLHELSLARLTLEEAHYETFGAEETVSELRLLRVEAPNLDARSLWNRLGDIRWKGFRELAKRNPRPRGAARHWAMAKGLPPPVDPYAPIDVASQRVDAVMADDVRNRVPNAPPLAELARAYRRE